MLHWRNKKSNPYLSIKQAEIETSVKAKNISKMINGKINSTGGYIWKRID